MTESGIVVRVPATAANLGPGFDCLGVALGAYLELRITAAPAPELAGGDPAIGLEDDLTYRAFRRAFAAAGEEAPPVRIETVTAYAHARGMGSSAAAIVAGLVGARAVGGLALDDSDLAGLAIEIEGHADNVLPALFGGLVLAVGGGWIRFEPSPAIAPVVLVARDRFATSQSRAVLPESVARADAVANAAATAALVAAVVGATSAEALLAATADRLHEPYRLPLLEDTADLHGRLRAAGVAAALSGAGPSVVCLVAAEALDEVVVLATALIAEGWQILLPGWDLDGAKVR